jgi:hypothetical protein
MCSVCDFVVSVFELVREAQGMVNLPAEIRSALARRAHALEVDGAP